MVHQCYYCEQLFDTKERLYNHLEVHSKPKSSNSEGESKLSDEQILEQFNDTKTGEPSRMAGKN